MILVFELEVLLSKLMIVWSFGFISAPNTAFIYAFGIVQSLSITVFLRYQHPPSSPSPHSSKVNIMSLSFVFCVSLSHSSSGAARYDLGREADQCRAAMLTLASKLKRDDGGRTARTPAASDSTHRVSIRDRLLTKGTWVRASPPIRRESYIYVLIMQC